MHATHVLAFDLNAKAREVCLALAAYRGQRALVLCDIEGAEHSLLDLAAAPDLASMDLIVESHDALRPGMTGDLMRRFAATHDITLVTDDGQRSLDSAPDWFRNLAHLDQLLATWEWRSGPTPWLVMRARQPRTTLIRRSRRVSVGFHLWAAQRVRGRGVST
jgi:hypothetical protein